jgi:hypothetical protein
MRVLTLLLLAFSINVAADETDAAGAKLYEYFEVFNAKDIEKVSNYIYSTPVHIGGGDSHRVLADPVAAAENLTNLYAQLDKQGWKESVIDDLKICHASETLALVDTRYSRMDQDGQAIPPAIRTTLYVLQKIDDRWAIVAFYGHDSANRPTCD